MTMTTPSIQQPIKAFIPSVAYDISFSYNSGSQAVKNNLVIQRLSDNVEVYNQTVDSFSLKHTIPANKLVSGIAYKAKIRVGSISNEWSQFSEWAIFWVLDKPTITIDTIDYENQNRVYNQTVTFSSTYTHPDNENLQSYRYFLYDGNKILLQSYPEQFNDGNSPLTQEITGLKNGEVYHVEVKTLSVNQQESSSGLIMFRPFYIAPNLISALTVENMASEGSVKITGNIIQIIGKLYDANGNIIEDLNIEYVDSQKIDLNRLDYDKLIFNEGFAIASPDFILKIWVENLPDDTVFLTLLSENGKVNLMKYNNRIHSFKYLNNNETTYAHFASNEFTFVENVQYMIYLKSTNNLIDIEVITS